MTLGFNLGGARAAAGIDSSAPVVWKLSDPQAIAGVPAVVLGAPGIERDADGPFAVFNGRSDGFILPAAPLAGRSEFTVEVRFRPDPDGPPAQRFIHLEDEAGRRMTFETRIIGRQWALDTYLADGESKLPLYDATLLHPAARWYWAALRYDGHVMTSFVDGRPELSGRVQFGPMSSGHIGVGMRMNRVYWFKGAIREIRFFPSALSDAAVAGESSFPGRRDQPPM